MSATFVATYQDITTRKLFGTASREVNNVGEALFAVGMVMRDLMLSNTYSMEEAYTVAQQWDQNVTSSDPCPCGSLSCGNVVLSIPFNSRTDLVFMYLP